MVLALHAEARDQAVQVALAPAFGLDLHRRRLAQQRLGIDFAPLREQVDIEGEKLAQLLAAPQLPELQLLSQGRLDGDAACHFASASAILAHHSESERPRS